jgi:hypothetical protein
MRGLEVNFYWNVIDRYQFFRSGIMDQITILWSYSIVSLGLFLLQEIIILVTDLKYELKIILLLLLLFLLAVWECIQKFPDRPPGTGTASGTALCH